MDTCCQQRLLTHLNGNLGFYNRAIWLLQDPTERQVLIDNALQLRPDLLGGVDTVPIAVSGTHVAFGFTPLGEPADNGTAADANEEEGEDAERM